VARITIPSASSLTLQGWGAYQAGDFDGATTYFDWASQTVENYAPAAAAVAWIDFREDRFDEALAVWLSLAGEGNTDALAGLVLFYTSANNPQSVIDGGKELLQRDSDYVFPGDPEYSATDIRWLIARAALETGNYAETSAQLDVLSPGHTLDPEAATFPEEALILLESLQGTV